MIGIGIDVVDVVRFTLFLERRGAHGRARLFTERELADAREDPRRLAARFAAKEAAMKALGVGLGAFGFHEVSIAREADGRPTLVVVGRAAELASSAGATRWLVSLTHTDIVAEAVVCLV